MDGYPDGAIWFELDGADGHYSVVCIDIREGSPTRYRLFEGTLRPEKPGAVLIPLGSWEEGVVVPTLSSWLDSETARKSIRPEAIERAIQYLLRLGELDFEGAAEPLASSTPLDVG